MINDSILCALRIVVGLSLTISIWACQQQLVHPEVVQVQYTPNFKLAKTSTELTALRKDPSANIVRTLAEYDTYAMGTPVAKLSATTQQQLRESLMIKPGVGVVSFKYAGIQSILSEDDFAQVLAMFGMDSKDGFWGFSRDPNVIRVLNESKEMSEGERLINFTSKKPVVRNKQDELTQFEGGDHKGYKCSTLWQHTCEPAAGLICLSGC